MQRLLWIVKKQINKTKPHKNNQQPRFNWCSQEVVSINLYFISTNAINVMELRLTRTKGTKSVCQRSERLTNGMSKSLSCQCTGWKLQTQSSWTLQLDLCIKQTVVEITFISIIYVYKLDLSDGRVERPRIRRIHPGNTSVHRTSKIRC